MLATTENEAFCFPCYHCWKNLYPSRDASKYNGPNRDKMNGNKTILDQIKLWPN